MKKHDRKLLDKQLKIEKMFNEVRRLYGECGIKEMGDEFHTDMSAIICNHELQQEYEIDDLHFDLINGQITENEYKQQSLAIRKVNDKKLRFQLDENEGKHMQKLSQLIKNAKEYLI